jgi:hypothetical protein
VIVPVRIAVKKAAVELQWGFVVRRCRMTEEEQRIYFDTGRLGPRGHGRQNPLKAGGVEKILCTKGQGCGRGEARRRQAYFTTVGSELGGHDHVGYTRIEAIALKLDASGAGRAAAASLSEGNVRRRTGQPGS